MLEKSPWMLFTNKKKNGEDTRLSMIFTAIAAKHLPDAITVCRRASTVDRLQLMIYTLVAMIGHRALLAWLATLILWVGVPAFQARAQQILQPPEVLVNSPREGEVILRNEPLPGNSRMTDTSDHYMVEASVSWPDGAARGIATAQLWVDGVLVGEVLNPAVDHFQLEWALGAVGSEEGEPVRLQVLVRDETGLENASEPVNVVVRLVLNEGITGIEEKSQCDSGTLLADWFCLVSNTVGGSGQLLRMVGFVALALAFLWWARQRKNLMAAEKRDPPMERSRETITRITAPVSANVAGYLEVLQGDIDMIGKRIALYEDAKTLAGRSLYEAEIVFNMNSSTSVVSRRHCEFIGRKGEIVLRDLGSTQGTYLNGERLPKGGDGKILRDGDQVELGPAEQGGVVLRFTSSEKTNSHQ
jgi:hypothetical protein